jgi:competence protein ComEA
MSMRSDHKALLFLGAVGVLGAGVRVVRTAGGQQAPATQPALDRQMRVADSAAAAQRKAKSNSQGPARGRGSGRGKKASGDSTDAAKGQSSQGGPGRVRPASPGLAGSLDRPGYIGKRLDLDVATAAQIDSLPGVTPLMARRIADDRVRRGPFLSMSGLQRVSGVGHGFMQKIDTLVTFSGTYAFPSPSDTIIKARKKRRP